MVMIILGNYKNNYDIATKTAQWALTPKQLNLVITNMVIMAVMAKMPEMPEMHVMAILTLMATMAVIPTTTVLAATSVSFSISVCYGNSCSYE